MMFKISTQIIGTKVSPIYQLMRILCDFGFDVWRLNIKYIHSTAWNVQGHDICPELTDCLFYMDMNPNNSMKTFNGYNRNEGLYIDGIWWKSRIFTNLVCQIFQFWGEEFDLVFNFHKNYYWVYDRDGGIIKASLCIVCELSVYVGVSVIEYVPGWVNVCVWVRESLICKCHLLHGKCWCQQQPQNKHLNTGNVHPTGKWSFQFDT